MASFLWFLYWIGYDIFVWTKPLVKVNWVNYAGAILSVAFILASFQLQKLKDRVGKTKKNEQNDQQTKIEERTNIEETVGIVKQNESTLEEQVKIEKPRHVTKRAKRKNKSVNPRLASSMPDSCSYNFGYLRQISKREEIPGECMTCEKLLQCRYY